MKLISEINIQDLFLKSNLYFDYSFKEAFNQILENSFFHFMRNKLFKIESKIYHFIVHQQKKFF